MLHRNIFSLSITFLGLWRETFLMARHENKYSPRKKEKELEQYNDDDGLMLQISLLMSDINFFSVPSPDYINSYGSNARRHLHTYMHCNNTPSLHFSLKQTPVTRFIFHRKREEEIFPRVFGESAGNTWIQRKKRRLASALPRTAISICQFTPSVHRAFGEPVWRFVSIVLGR